MDVPKGIKLPVCTKDKPFMMLATCKSGLPSDPGGWDIPVMRTRYTTRTEKSIIRYDSSMSKKVAIVHIQCYVRLLPNSCIQHPVCRLLPRWNHPNPHSPVIPPADVLPLFSRTYKSSRPGHRCISLSFPPRPGKRPAPPAPIRGFAGIV